MTINVKDKRPKTRSHTQNTANELPVDGISEATLESILVI